MNIGNWIVVAFILFTVFIATLVTVCVKQDISLVSKEYYKDELVYESQITRISNTAALDKLPTISMKGESLTIQLNTDHFRNGELLLFCPSNANMDKIITLERNITTINTAGLQRGMYRAKVRWTAENKDFYHEEVIYL